jgi:hypothetical protein
MNTLLLDAQTQKDTADVAPVNSVPSLSQGGLFTQASQLPIISAVTGLQRGFETVLPIRPALVENPTVKLITGIQEATAASGTDCAIYPTAGQFKLCHISNYPFGRYGMKSRSLDLTEVGLVDNDWTNQNQTVIGSPFANSPRTGLAPSSTSGAYQDVARSTIAKLISEMAFSSSVTWGREMLYGNPANDTGVDSIRRMRGLSLLINDDYSDNVTGVDCARVDSLVTDFSGKSVENNTNELVGLIVDYIAAFEQRQALMGFQTRWDGFLVMHYNLFRKLVFSWADTFYSYRTALNTTTEARIDAIALQNMRMQMLNGGYLISDTGNIPVITDPAVIETVAEGVYTSDIWFVNRTVNNTPTTYIEYLNMNTDTTALGAIRAMLGEGKFQVTDNGRFLLWRNTEGTCIRINMAYRTRLRVDTPFLCGVINNVDYTPNLLIQDTPFPQDAGYLNGGVTGPYAGAPGTIVNITVCTDNAAGVLDFTLDEAFSCTANGVVEVVIGNLVIPAQITAGVGTTSVTVDFTDAGITPAFFAAVVCADLDFTAGQLRCPYQVQ